MSRGEHAREQFQTGLNCSQAVLAEFAEDFGLELELAEKVACGFGAGMGRTGNVCGAVTGGVMALGLATCAPDPRALSTKAQVYELARSFIERFQAEHQSISCRDLLGCDLGTLEGYAEAKRLDLFTTRCPAYVETAVEIIEEMLE